jgi:hypothetical protein
VPQAQDGLRHRCEGQLATVQIKPSISHTHKRTEGRAPVWGSEFTAKVASLQGGQRKLLRQGGLDSNKISGVGTNFGLLVHVLPGPNKQLEAKPSIFLS